MVRMVDGIKRGMEGATRGLAGLMGGIKAAVDQDCISRGTKWE